MTGSPFRKKAPEDARDLSITPGFADPRPFAQPSPAMLEEANTATLVALTEQIHNLQHQLNLDIYKRRALRKTGLEALIASQQRCILALTAENEGLFRELAKPRRRPPASESRIEADSLLRLSTSDTRQAQARAHPADCFCESRARLLDCTIRFARSRDRFLAEEAHIRVAREWSSLNAREARISDFQHKILLLGQLQQVQADRQAAVAASRERVTAFREKLNELAELRTQEAQMRDTILGVEAVKQEIAALQKDARNSDFLRDAQLTQESQVDDAVRADLERQFPTNDDLGRAADELREKCRADRTKLTKEKREAAEILRDFRQQNRKLDMILEEAIRYCEALFENLGGECLNKELNQFELLRLKSWCFVDFSDVYGKQ
jgi:hypothetical protein